jgi:nitroreductase/NAD-dependent dihydropyrimidine dehydrogenase PreA subunit
METASRTIIRVAKDRCRKDGLCARVCPARIFRASKGEVPSVERAAECVLCGQCLCVCPAGAVEHSRLGAEMTRPIRDLGAADPELLEAFVLQRRSVRAYRDKPPPRDLLERVARAAGYAPTGAFGGDGWVRHVTVVSGEETMRRVREATVGYMRRLRKVLDGFVVKAVSRFSEQARSGRSTLPDLEMRLREWDEGRDVVTYDAPAAIFVSASWDTTTPHEDCDAALMNMMLAAHANGLGTCWNGWLGNAATAAHVSGPRVLGDLIGLPADHGIVEAFTVGWPAVRLHGLPERTTEIRWCE